MADEIYKSGSGGSSYSSDVSDEEWAFCAPLFDADEGRRTTKEAFDAQDV
jgi:hypothetical protein